MMQALHFGWIEELRIRDSQPVLDPGPKVIREVKLGARSRTRAPADEVVAKRQVQELLDTMDQIGDGVIKRVEVRHGLPFRLILEGDT